MRLIFATDALNTHWTADHHNKRSLKMPKAALRVAPAVPHKSLLSKREMEILRLTSEGHSTPRAADLLFISTHTLESHRRSILKKLKAANMTHAVALAMRQGIIE